MALLEINNLEYSYGQVKAVKGISMHVNEGEIVTLIGSNGAGKTTTLRTVSGLVSPQGVRGEILFDGQLIQKNPGYKIARLGLYQVLEGRHVFPKLTVEENLATGAYNVRDSRQVKDGIREVYRLFPRLEERKTSFGGNLSGGEQQMLAIGRALINRPKLMILDEPSLGLAPIIIREIFEPIKRINAEGTTILFVEQNARIALATAQRGYVLQTGKIELTDTCENLISNEEVQRIYLGTN